MMRFAVLLIAAVGCSAQVRVDNVLAKMVPPGTESLAGAHMEEIKATPLYQKMISAQKLPDLDRFAAETGFDPRRDVRELLFASTKNGGVLLARGKFRPGYVGQRMKVVRHGEYTILQSGESGFCILDSTLAAAGVVSVLEAALDEWKTGSHKAAAPLLARVKEMDPKSQFWGVSTGFANFVAGHMPSLSSGGVDFSQIFRTVEDTSFQLDMSKGLRAQIRGTAGKEQDAVSLRDAAKGLIGFGRLSVPENQPDLVRVWDGVTVEQNARNIVIKADVPQDLLDKLVQMMSAAQSARPNRRPVI